MRVAEDERIVVRTADVVVAGDTLLVAVRPERVRVQPTGSEASGVQAAGDSRVSGTVAQVVYLGTMTQFHVDTATGHRLTAHRLSDDAAGAIHEGDPVQLSWDRDDASVLTR
jgi:ABC-type Fe3+/spermidine/putrescine transport system ATPase subunit